MEIISEADFKFISEFSKSEKLSGFGTVKYKSNTDFLNNDCGKKYLLYFLKDIDTRLYLVFLEMIKSGKISFLEKFNPEEAFCYLIVDSSNNSIMSSGLNLPYLNNGFSLMVAAHELGHGLRHSRRSGNSRFDIDKSMFDESISIFFGYLCMERYIQDFGINDQSTAFEILNINNAVSCNNLLGYNLEEYIKALEIYEKSKAGNFVYSIKVNELTKKVYTMISYPIGFALLNAYINMSQSQKEKYLKLITSYILSDTNISIIDILSYFIPATNPEFYKINFNEYIKNSTKRLELLGGKLL